MDFVVVVPVITAVIQALKVAFLPNRFAPVVAIVLGIAYSAFANTVFNFDTVLFGLLVGLSASGLYDAGKLGIKESKTVINKLK